MWTLLRSGFAYLLLCLGLLACRPAPAPAPTQVLQGTATTQPTQAVQVTEPSQPTQAAGSIVHAQPVFNCTAATELPVYTVIAGDTLYSLAARAGMTVAELQETNCLPRSDTRLEVGQRLYVRNLPEPLATSTLAAAPTDEAPTATPPPVITVLPTLFTLTPEPPTPIPPTHTAVVIQHTLTATTAPTIVSCVPQSTWPIYTVVTGDTMYSIAARTGMTVAGLQDANCISRASTVIFVGQRLYVRVLPAPPATPTP